MKKIIKKVLKPEKSFEQWALDNNIALPERRLHPKKRCILKWITVATMTFIICLSITLPLIYGNIEPRNYLESDSHLIIKEVENEEELIRFFNSKNILFFNSDRIPDEQNIPQILSNVVKDDETLILSYSISDYYIKFNVDEQQFFLLDYRVVVYKNYTFMTQSSYSDSDASFEESGKRIYYKITNLFQGSSAFVRFSYNGYDYYLRIGEVPELENSKLTESSLRDFFVNLFV